MSASSFLERPSRLPFFTSNRTRVILSLPLRAFSEGAELMEWTTPKHEEIDLNCEVSSYANAEL
jgi:hypothetical protein